MNKSEIRKELQRERAMQKRLAERRDLAIANLTLSFKREESLKERLTVAPDAPKFFF